MCAAPPKSTSRLAEALLEPEAVAHGAVRFAPVNERHRLRAAGDRRRLGLQDVVRVHRGEPLGRRVDGRAAAAPGRAPRHGPRRVVRGVEALLGAGREQRARRRLPSTEALKTALPLLKRPKPGAVSVIPSCQDPGRQARPALASSRAWLYSYSLPTNAACDALPEISSSDSERRLRCAR